MKDAVLLLLCAVALAQATNQSPDQRSRPCNCDPSEAQQICQANYDNDDVLIAHENCNQFYKCANGQPVAYFCPNNLLYDPLSETCDWSDNVDCGDRPISEVPDNEEDSDNDDVSDVDNDWTCNCNPGEAPSICAAEDSNGVLVAHENCNQFYICTAGRPVTLDCSAPLLYNPYKEACDWAHNVECGDRVIPDPKDDDSSDVDDSIENDVTCNCNPEEAPAICAAPDSEGELIAHEDCNKYYICNHGLPMAVSCFGDLLFNPFTRECDWPRHVDCGDRLVPETECTGCNNNASDDASCDGDDDTTPSQDTQAPPLGPEDSESSDIRPPGDDVVVPQPPPGTCNCNPEEAPSICAADESDGVLVAHENCNQFYKCDHGIPAALTCHGDLLYNPYTEQCDWPENVDCGDRVTPDPDASVSTPGVTNPGATNPDVTNPGETNPGVTNPADTTPGNNSDPSEAPAICAEDDSEGVLVAHENCNQFYKCSGGEPVALICPPNLLFNPAKDQCDWPENVDCGDRVIPEPDDIVSTPVVTNPDVTNPGVTNPGVSNPGETNPGVTNPADTTPGNNCDPSEAPAICAEDDSEGVLVAHENCNQFYKCSGGEPVALICPPNLLFNPAKDQCDWPENVDCGDRVTPDPDDSVSNPGVTNPDVTNPGVTNPGETNPDVTNPADTTPGNNCDPSEAPAICAEDDSEGVLVAHENCDQFYKCSGGKPVALICPPNLLFNPTKDQCDWPENVDCGERVIPDPESSGSDSSDIRPPADDVVIPTRPPGTCNCNPEEAPSICAADDSNGVLVAHENCNQFYKCDHGSPVVLTCYGDLLYNPYTEQCDWPENVDCGDRVTPDPDVSVSTPGVTNPGATNPGVTNPDETNPGVTNPADTTPGNNCDPSEAPAICAEDDSEGVLVAHENCNQFYKCSGGKPVALTCPPNLMFNPNKDQCDWPFNVDCGDRVIPDPEDTEDSDSDTSEIRPPGDGVSPQPPVEGSNEDCSGNGDENGGTCNCDPDQAPSICSVDSSDGILVAHENCNQFYLCNNGRPVPLNCPANTLYNPVTQVCDWASNVECGDRIIPDPEDNVTESKEDDSEVEEEIVGPCNCNPEEAPAICAVNGSSGVKIAHENCNQFYVCDHGGPVAFTCNGFLLYNPYTERCDWPENVECGDRGIPEPGSESDENDSVEEDNNSNPNDDPSQAPTICAGDESEGVLVAHENCEQYYICSGGVPVSRPCNDGLLFNPINQRCDWPSNVVCGDRIVPDECACNPRNAPALCARPESEGKLIAHENCNQFYLCAHSVPVPQSCPASLLYNIDKELCDWPQNVNCENRLLLFSSLNKHWQSRQTLRN